MKISMNKILIFIIFLLSVYNPALSAQPVLNNKQIRSWSFNVSIGLLEWAEIQCHKQINGKFSVGVKYGYYGILNGGWYYGLTSGYHFDMTGNGNFLSVNTIRLGFEYIKNLDPILPMRIFPYRNKQDPSTYIISLLVGHDHLFPRKFGLNVFYGICYEFSYDKYVEPAPSKKTIILPMIKFEFKWNIS